MSLKYGNQKKIRSFKHAHTLTRAPWFGKYYDAKWADEIPPESFEASCYKPQRTNANNVSDLDKVSRVLQTPTHQNTLELCNQTYVVTWLKRSKNNTAALKMLLDWTGFIRSKEALLTSVMTCAHGAHECLRLHPSNESLILTTVRQTGAFPDDLPHYRYVTKMKPCSFSDLQEPKASTPTDRPET